MTGSRTANIRDGLIQLIKTHGGSGGGSNECFTASVTAVDIPSRTCTIQGISSQVQMEFTGVLLMPSVSDGVLYVPTIDSIVIIQNNANLQPYVSMFSEVDQILYIVSGATGTEIKMTADNVVISQDKIAVTLSGGKVNIKNDSKDFKTIMDNLFSHILALTVGTGTGPSTVPINASDFTQDQQDFNALFS